jgi:hypothetical protein
VCPKDVISFPRFPFGVLHFPGFSFFFFPGDSSPNLYQNLLSDFKTKFFKIQADSESGKHFSESGDTTWKSQKGVRTEELKRGILWFLGFPVFWCNWKDLF